MDGHVTLNIYDVWGNTGAVNAVCRAIGTGAFHAGVEVYGNEWSYGFNPGGTGVFCTPPRGCVEHQFREAVPMGHVRLSAEEVQQLIDELAQAWHGEHYDLLRRNCCHFSDTLCWRLGVGRIPDWVTNLAGVGAMLRSGVFSAQRGAARGIQNAQGMVQRALKGGPGSRDAPPPGHRPPPQVPPQPWQPPPDAGYANQPSPYPAYPEACGTASPAWSPHPAEAQWVPPPTDPYAHAAAPEGRIGVGEAVEVYSNSTRQWLPGHVESLNHDTMVVAFQWPGAAPGDFARKELPVGHRDVRRAAAGSPKQRQPQPSAFAPEPAGHLVGEWVEIFSNSNQVWCWGYVESSRGTSIMVAFRLPQAGPNDWSRKELPMDHKDLRWPKARGPMFCAGDWVEIYSNSNQVWCPGRVTKVTANSVSVAFYVPGGDVNDWAEKDVPLGSQDIRHVDSGPTEARQILWTAAEEKSYATAFQTLAADGKVNIDSLQRFLSRSRLDPDILKEIVRVANPEKKQALRLQEFSVCCRLVCHCLAMQRDPGLSQVLNETGVPLRLVLQTQFLYTPPPKGPEFPGPPPKSAGPSSSNRAFS
mmetsp:Transcript_65287/g.156034  ORF Transcript_65287/g.156034 Transcript_65287/m.156034 type:complete len:585 (-) Transcript_65287:5-1759(-)